MHFWLIAVRSGLFLISLSAVSYFLYSIYAAIDFFSGSRPPRDGFHPPISILKPIRGLDPDSYLNLAAFCRQDYPEYEVILGAADEDDPGIEVVRQIVRDFPERDLRLVVGAKSIGTNPKVSNIANMAAVAKYPLLLISDSDIRVGPHHLQAMVQPLSDPAVGVVTCLYRSRGRGWAGRLDALWLTTEFQPSVLVARKLEGLSFAMGSGILIRKSVLAGIGGFAAFADELADDFAMGNLPARAGHAVAFGNDVVEHLLGTDSFPELVRHQLRWYRGIRAHRPWGYAGLAFTQGTSASLLFLLAMGGSPLGWAVFSTTLAVRLAMAWIVSGGYLGDREARRLLWLVPFRDLLSSVVWGLAFGGREVHWRGRRFRVLPGGKLEVPGAPALAEPAAEEAGAES
jgi:ceramide glucosyltransferase